MKKLTLALLFIIMVSVVFATNVVAQQIDCERAINDLQNEGYIRITPVIEEHIGFAIDPVIWNGIEQDVKIKLCDCFISLFKVEVVMVFNAFDTERLLTIYSITDGFIDGDFVEF